jgi:Flp pilus assembly protein TadD
MNNVSNHSPSLRRPLHAVFGRKALCVGLLWVASMTAPVWAQVQDKDWVPGQVIDKIYQSDPHEEVRKLLRRAKYEQALVIVRKNVTLNPRDPQMRFWEGYIYEQLGQPQLAKPIYVSLTQEYPELAEPHNNLGVILAAEGNYGEARQMFELALRANPRNAVAQENLGDVLLQLARQAYQKSLDIDPKQRTAAKKIELIQPAAALSEKKP